MQSFSPSDKEFRIGFHVSTWSKLLGTLIPRLRTPQNVWFWNVGDTENKCQEGGAQEILDHLNTIEPGVIVLAKEDQEGDVLPVLDLKRTVDRKTKIIMYSSITRRLTQT